MTAPIDLSKLPPPDVVEELDLATVVTNALTYFQGLDSTYTGLVASDPAYKTLEAAGYLEYLYRQRVNDAARAVMLAKSTGADLDNIGALPWINVERLVIDPGNPSAVPPVAATYEDDDAYRERLQLALDGYSTAGSEESYIFHGRGADGSVKDISAFSDSSAVVTVTVLSQVGDGTPDAALLTAVTDALNATTVRPLTDSVVVQAATINTYTVDITLTVFSGPDPETVRTESETALQTYVDKSHRLGRDITLAGITAAAVVEGVQNIVITSPAADIVNDDTQASYCTGVTVTVGGIGD